MSDNALIGYLGVLYISDDGGASYAAFTEIKDFKPARTRKTVDSTSHADAGEESYKLTTKGWTASADVLYVPGDPAQAKLSAAFNGGTKLKLRFDPNGTATGKPRFSGDAYIETITGPDNPVEGVIVQTVTFKGTGALTEGVQ
jgi:hypothetical protein